MKQKEISPVRLLLRWAGPEKKWLIGSVLCAFGSGLLAITAYLGLYRLMDAVLSGTCTPAVIADCAVFVMAGTVGRMVLLGASGVLSHKGAYGALFRVRCMVTEHLAKVPLGALDERSTGAVKTVLNEDIEKLELFLAHNLPEFVAYLSGGCQPLPGELQLGDDRVCLRDAAHQGVQHGEPVVSEVFPRHFGGKPDLEPGDP